MKRDPLPSNATLLSVLAHPDDETFGTGGTLALYARRGVAVYLVCGTRGEVGEMPADMMKGFSSVAEVRESELRCAAQTLGLRSVHFLGYRDSGMPGSPENRHPLALAAQPVDEVAARIVTQIRRIKPQIVITFDPIGGYFHPDHIAIHKATVRAFELTGRQDYIDPEELPPFQPARLFFQTINRGFLKAAILLMQLSGKDPHKFGKNGDIDMVAIASQNFPIHAKINYHEVADLRDQASACHESQGGREMAKGVQKWLQRLFQTTELFMLAYPQPVKKQVMYDLFSGLQG